MRKEPTSGQDIHQHCTVNIHAPNDILFLSGYLSLCDTIKTMSFDYQRMAADIRRLALDSGFSGVGITDIQLDAAEIRFIEWLNRGFHGEMRYMERHGSKRSRPDELVPGTVSVISVRLNYMHDAGTRPIHSVLDDPDSAYIARYALGRDYHKLIRQRLQQFANQLQAIYGTFGYRVFTDSAPVLEKPLATGAGLGWIGKHTNLIDTHDGSWFFLGEIYTDLPLPTDTAGTDHCGTCRRCIDACPTGAIVAEYQLDARRCIAYHTIELFGSIPVEFRKAIGNRIFGCDDCQWVCPHNKDASSSDIEDFLPRHGLDDASLIELFAWSSDDFDDRTRGSAIRRLGHERWLRNIAVALGNAPTTEATVAALTARRMHPSAIVREHVEWALGEHGVDADN